MARLTEIVSSCAPTGLTRTALSDGSGVVLDVQGLAVYSLNETGMFLVEACARAPRSDAWRRAWWTRSRWTRRRRAPTLPSSSKSSPN